MTYRQARQWAIAYLAERGVEEAEADATLLLYEAADLTMTRYLVCSEEQMPESQQAAYAAMVEKRGQRIPLQHILGYQEFMGLTFQTGPQALVPRQDTEVLVEEALGYLNGKAKPKVLDLCTGTGCIAVSIARYCTGAEVTASDLSKEALELAEKNAARSGADIHFIHSDLFAKIPGKFDLIVSNPPYIPDEVIATLAPEVKEHDPYMALSGGADGLEIYKKLIPQAAEHLCAGGALLLEIGSDQGESVPALMQEVGYRHIYTKQDLAGLDRIVGGIRV